MSKWKDANERLPGVRKVLAMCKSKAGIRSIVIARYLRAEEIVCYCDDTETCDCEYDKYTDEHFLPEGWYEISDNGDVYFTPISEGTVTHWRKLPKLLKLDT